MHVKNTSNCLTIPNQDAPATQSWAPSVAQSHVSHHRWLAPAPEAQAGLSAHTDPPQLPLHLPVQTVPFPWNPAAHLHEALPSGSRRQLQWKGQTPFSEKHHILHMTYNPPSAQHPGCQLYEALRGPAKDSRGQLVPGMIPTSQWKTTATPGKSHGMPTRHGHSTSQSYPCDWLSFGPHVVHR